MPETPTVRPFAAFLRDHRKGLTHTELGERMAELTQAVTETGKVGTLSITFKVKPLQDGIVTVTDAITSKLPQLERDASMFFTDEAGNLLRNDPRQMEIGDLREAPGPQAKEATP